MFDPTIVLSAGAGLLLVAGFSFKATHDRLARLDERCNTAWADIDTQLKHRHAIVPGLIEVTRAMAAHEKAIIAEVCKAQDATKNGAEPGRRLLAEKLFGESVGKLITVSMQYPEIKASARFQDLARELAHVEELITGARRFYNMAVGEYNAARRSMTGKLVGSVFAQAPREPFDLGIDRVAMDEPMTVRL
jgi:LemA protein